ncbi:MAG: tetratricopeptide repeat protein [Nitrospiraceae bacterium]|nr:tetratricopeptide repeat protein [Nitrospiraceae bacterium]
MADDIEKLKERIRKEPGSRLFLALAEQYRNMGNLDEAMEVLKSGLQSQPAYMSARVALGKIYLEKNMTAEAATEFETVVKSIPDNLFAQKKLADIYLAQGEQEKARKALETVVALNPMDEAAVAALKEMQGPAQQPGNMEGLLEPTSFSAEINTEDGPQAVLAGPAAEVDDEPVNQPENGAFDVEETSSSEAVPEPDPFDADEAGIQVEDQSVSSLESLGEIAEVIPGAQEEPDEAGTIEIDDSGAEDAGTGDFSFAQAETAIPAAMDVIPEGTPEGTPETAREEMPQEISEKIPQAAAPEPVEEKIDVPVAGQIKPAASIRIPAGNTSLKDADAFIAAGKFAQAVMIFKRRLEADPADKMARQKFEELKMLLKILKKRASVNADILNGFLLAMEKRKGEFLGSA